MAAEKHCRALVLGLYTWTRAVARHPGLHRAAREQQLSGGPGAGHFAAGGELVDLALLEPQQFG